MKGGLAVDDARRPRPRRARSGVRVHFVCVADEESEEVDQRGSDYLVEQGYIGDFAITGEPTDMHIGIQAKGVLAMRIEVTGTAAHGSTPWVGRQRGAQGDRRLPPDRGAARSRASRPTCSTGPRSTSAASSAATRSTRCPTCARSTSTCATCPARTPTRSAPRSTTLPDARVVKVFHRRPAIVDRENPYVQALGEAIARVAPPRRRADLGRPRRRLRRDLVPRGGRAGGRVRARPAPATTAPRSGCRSGRSGNIGGRWSSSSTCSRPGWARTSARCESPDARGHPPPRTLEAPPAGGASWSCSPPPGRRRWRRSTRSTRSSRRSSSARSSSSARASSPPPTRASRRR